MSIETIIVAVIVLGAFIWGAFRVYHTVTHPGCCGCKSCGGCSGKCENCGSHANEKKHETNDDTTQN